MRPKNREIQFEDFIATNDLAPYQAKGLDNTLEKYRKQFNGLVLDKKNQLKEIFHYNLGHLNVRLALKFLRGSALDKKTREKYFFQYLAKAEKNYLTAHQGFAGKIKANELTDTEKKLISAIQNSRGAISFMRYMYFQQKKDKKPGDNEKQRQYLQEANQFFRDAKMQDAQNKRAELNIRLSEQHFINLKRIKIEDYLYKSSKTKGFCPRNMGTFKKTLKQYEKDYNSLNASQKKWNKHVFLFNTANLYLSSALKDLGKYLPQTKYSGGPATVRGMSSGVKEKIRQSLNDAEKRFHQSLQECTRAKKTHGPRRMKYIAARIHNNIAVIQLHHYLLVKTYDQGEIIDLESRKLYLNGAVEHFQKAQRLYPDLKSASENLQLVLNERIQVSVKIKFKKVELERLKKKKIKKGKTRFSISETERKLQLRLRMFRGPSLRVSVDEDLSKKAYKKQHLTVKSVKKKYQSSLKKVAALMKKVPALKKERAKIMAIVKGLEKARKNQEAAKKASNILLARKFPANKLPKLFKGKKWKEVKEKKKGLPKSETVLRGDPTVRTFQKVGNEIEKILRSIEKFLEKIPIVSLIAKILKEVRKLAFAAKESHAAEQSNVAENPIMGMLSATKESLQKNLTHFRVHPPLRGNYKNGSRTIFNRWRGVWRPREIKGKTFAGSEVAKTHSMMAEVSGRKKLFALPMPEGYAPNTASFQFNKNVAYRVIRTPDKLFYLQLERAPGGKFFYKFQFGEHQIAQEKPGYNSLAKLHTGALSLLTERFLQSLRTKRLSVLQKATLISQFIKANGEYSLADKKRAINIMRPPNKMIQNIERRSTIRYKSNGKWVTRKMMKLHCAAAATYFVALARTVGIHSRYVSGYHENGNGKLSSSEAHAWVEFYDPKSKQWIMIDPTPSDRDGDIKGWFPQDDVPQYTKKDKKTEEALKRFRKKMYLLAKLPELEEKLKKTEKEKKILEREKMAIKYRMFLQEELAKKTKPYHLEIKRRANLRAEWRKEYRKFEKASKKIKSPKRLFEYCYVNCSKLERQFKEMTKKGKKLDVPTLYPFIEYYFQVLEKSMSLTRKSKNFAVIQAIFLRTMNEYLRLLQAEDPKRKLPKEVWEVYSMLPLQNGLGYYQGKDHLYFLQAKGKHGKDSERFGIVDRSAYLPSYTALKKYPLIKGFKGPDRFSAGSRIYPTSVPGVYITLRSSSGEGHHLRIVSLNNKYKIKKYVRNGIPNASGYHMFKDKNYVMTVHPAKGGGGIAFLMDVKNGGSLRRLGTYKKTIIIVDKKEDGALFRTIGTVNGKTGFTYCSIIKGKAKIFKLKLDTMKYTVKLAAKGKLLLYHKTYKKKGSTRKLFIIYNGKKYTVKAPILKDTYTELVVSDDGRHIENVNHGGRTEFTIKFNGKKWIVRAKKRPLGVKIKGKNFMPSYLYGKKSNGFIIRGQRVFRWVRGTIDSKVDTIAKITKLEIENPATGQKVDFAQMIQREIPMGKNCRMPKLIQVIPGKNPILIVKTGPREYLALRKGAGVRRMFLGGVDDPDYGGKYIFKKPLKYGRPSNYQFTPNYLIFKNQKGKLMYLPRHSVAENSFDDVIMKPFKRGEELGFKTHGELFFRENKLNKIASKFLKMNWENLNVDNAISFLRLYMKLTARAFNAKRINNTILRALTHVMRKITALPKKEQLKYRTLTRHIDNLLGETFRRKRLITKNSPKSRALMLYMADYFDRKPRLRGWVFFKQIEKIKGMAEHLFENHVGGLLTNKTVKENGKKLKRWKRLFRTLPMQRRNTIVKDYFQKSIKKNQKKWKNMDISILEAYKDLSEANIFMKSEVEGRTPKKKLSERRG